MTSLLILLLRTKKMFILNKKETSQLAKMNGTEVNYAFFDEN